MKYSFLCVIGISLLAQTQPFMVYKSMGSLFTSMFEGVQKLFLNMGQQIPGSFQKEQEDSSTPKNSGGEIYVAVRTTKPFAASSQLIQTYDECFNRVKVNPESIERLIRGDWIEEYELKAWVHCVLVENGLMTNQSVFRLDVAFQSVSSFERPILEAKIDKCLPTTAMEPLDISWHFAKCYQRVNREKSLF